MYYPRELLQDVHWKVTLYPPICQKHVGQLTLMNQELHSCPVSVGYLHALVYVLVRTIYIVCLEFCMGHWSFPRHSYHCVLMDIYFVLWDYNLMLIFLIVGLKGRLCG